MIYLNTTLYRNPKLIVVKLDDLFYCAFNLHMRISARILNERQYKILSLINNSNSIKDIACELNYKINDVFKAIRLLKSQDLTNFSGVFKEYKFSETQSLHLWIHTTDRCMLKCNYCYIKTLGNASSMGLETKSKLITKIVETVRIEKLKLVSLSLAGGEPLIEIGCWIDFYEELKKKLAILDCILDMGVITNLVAMTPKLIELFKKKGIGVACSIDGIGEHHDRSRHFPNGEGSFDIVNRNLELMLKSGLKPNVLVVISNDNINGLLALTKKLVDLNLHFRFSIVQAEFVDFKKITSVLISCYNYIETQVEQGYHFTRKHQFANTGINKASRQACGAGINSAAVYVNGDICFCHTDFGIRPKIGSIYSPDSLLQIIGASKLVLRAECISCIYNLKCGGLCPRRTDTEELCTLHREIFPILFRIAGKERLYTLMKKTSHS